MGSIMSLKRKPANSYIEMLDSMLLLLNSSLMKLDQNVKNLNINVNKNTNGNNNCTYSCKQNRSTEGCSKLKRSIDMPSSRMNSLNIRTNASPKWDRTRCPEE